MTTLQEYNAGASASASNLLTEFTLINNVVESCIDMLLLTSEDDPDGRKWQVIQNAANVLMVLQTHLEICEGIAENVWGKVFRLEEETWHLQAASEQSNG